MLNIKDFWSRLIMAGTVIFALAIFVGVMLIYAGIRVIQYLWF